ncbi:DUF2157 domain-containing protein [Psychrobacter glacincola]|uniref:DUF2157 domain-containing protein n=1 Tax=Psychrobacter glacincola TaxID=56810 RepID=UPI003FD2B60F
MSQPRRTIEHLLKQGILPLTHANDAAIHLQVYPSKRSWLVFFDKALLIIGAIALVLSLVFFIAYNWINMGKMGKFALVEGALVITIALYVALSFRRRFQLIRQLLLLIASVITGSLLALFGQVYQTGADTWQLFFGWAVLITPWVIIARFPALWLLWLGLVNAGLILYFGVTDFAFASYFYEGVLQIGVLAAVNFVALNLWLAFIDRQPSSVTRSRFKSELDWSTYVVGLLSSYFITYLAILYVFDDANILMTLIALLLWMSWCGFMVWRFYWYRINLLMLTYLCGSIIVVVMFWAGKLFLDNFDMGGFLILALLLIGMSSAAVVWLRHAARLNNENNLPSAVVKGGNYE